MRKILAPHKEQEGWVYIRLPRAAVGREDNHFDWYKWGMSGLNFACYDDRYPKDRIISSRRVEEAVETADYLKRCADEGLHVVYHPDEGPALTVYTARWDIGWHVFIPGQRGISGPTLREAYYRYKSQEATDAT